MIHTQLIETLRTDAKLFHSTIHGFTHWQTVANNGLYLAQFTGADTEVVKHFAYFHDCMRIDEYEDLEHGPRAAAFLKSIQHRIPLDDGQFQLLLRACSGHTFARDTDCSTLGTCWDADRLDLGRVGITPDSRYLFTTPAKEIADGGDYHVLLNAGSIDQGDV